MTREEIFRRISQTLSELFELDPQTVTMEARFVEDLDLDSIDAVDMAAKIQEITGRRLEEDDLRRIRTVADIVDIIDRMLRAKPGRGG